MCGGLLLRSVVHVVALPCYPYVNIDVLDRIHTHDPDISLCCEHVYLKNMVYLYVNSRFTAGGSNRLNAFRSSLFCYRL
jgi:hypothetical protein